jgi:hypothetical protein
MIKSEVRFEGDFAGLDIAVKSTTKEGCNNLPAVDTADRIGIASCRTTKDDTENPIVPRGFEFGLVRELLCKAQSEAFAPNREAEGPSWVF